MTADPRRARRFALLVVLAGALVFAFAALHAPPLGDGRHRAELLILVAGVFAGEFLPFTIPRGGEDEQITISTTFSFALLLVGGLLPAIAAQAAGVAAQDLLERKPLWRAAFNVAQYAVALAAAAATMHLLGAAPDLLARQPFTAVDLPAVAVAAAVFFAVNTGLVGSAVALYQGQAVADYLRRDLAFSALMGAVLLCVAPILVAATVYSPALVPLFALPMIATYVAGRQASRIEHRARHDTLTGLANRSTFQTSTQDLLAAGPAVPCAVLLMDLDRFKDVNDSLGHHHGDLLLREVAERLRRAVPEAHVISRLGGDEFAVLLGTGDEAEVAAGAGAISLALQQPFDVEGYVVDVEASIGAALHPEDAGTTELLLQRADVAMYRAKQLNLHYARYQEQHDHHSPARLALMADLRRAVGSTEIELWYQPKIEIESGALSGVEALVRWEHPDLGLLMPGAFLDIAEQTSLIKPLTLNVLDQALAQCRRWLDAGLDLQVAVNVSARSLLDRDFPSHVTGALRRAGVPAALLKLELTESLVMSDPAVAEAILAELSAAGICLAIDDFGTGYSSLSYLHRLPVDEVKIDRSFVEPMGEEGGDSVIVRSIVDLGHHLGLRVVAEGVEDRATLDTLRELGCDLAQGYYISRPVPAPQLERWLAAGHSPRLALVEEDAA